MHRVSARCVVSRSDGADYSLAVLSNINIGIKCGLLFSVLFVLCSSAIGGCA